MKKRASIYNYGRRLRFNVVCGLTARQLTLPHSGGNIQAKSIGWVSSLGTTGLYVYLGTVGDLDWTTMSGDKGCYLCMYLSPSQVSTSYHCTSCPDILRHLMNHEAVSREWVFLFTSLAPHYVVFFI